MKKSPAIARWPGFVFDSKLANDSEAWRSMTQMLSVKLRSLSEREGCLSLRSALASI